MQSIVDFSTAHGGPPSFPDGQALAVEVKLSWVDATTLPNGAQGYITSLAVVPTYDTSNPTDWVPRPGRLARVALVGAHIVGSANNHPEMIWATFEHQANTPLATYTYNSGGQPVTVSSNTSGQWLFSASGATPPGNTQLGTFCPGGTDQPPECTAASTNHIVAHTSAAIGPSNILREKAWGVASDGIPNQEDATPAAAATQILSLDTDVRSKLSAAGAGADPRFNYLLIGATWTIGGGEPTCPYPVTNCQAGNSNEIGTSLLANSTMETFVQGTDTTSGTGSNCLGCHNSSGSNPSVPADTYVSHIFDVVNPLPLSAQTTKGK